MITLAGARIVAAFFLAYLLPGFLRSRRRPEPGEGWVRVLHGFALTAACFEAVTIVLALSGHRFHYVEALVGTWFALLGYALFGGGADSLFRQLLLKVLRTIEAGRSQLGVRPLWQWVSPAYLIGGALLAVAAIHRAWFSMIYWRFETTEGYERTFSLFQTVNNNTAGPDVSVALLVPLMLFGGLDAASVVRYGDPLFSLLVCAAAGLAAFHVSRSYTAALLAFGLTAVLPVMVQNSLSKPTASQQMAALFLLVAGILAYSRRASAIAALATTALLGGLSIYPALAAGCVALAVLVDFAGRLAPGWDSLPARGVLAASFIAALGADLAKPIPDGPLQYESAARAAERIAQTFPRGEWFLVSPTHELTSVLGRGWHVELLDFLKDYDEKTVEPPDFKFPWQADIFIFVEKQPLTRTNERGGHIHGGHGMAMVNDRVVLAYGTPLGRTATQFKLARIVAAYARTHDNVSIYYQDPQLTVYRISRGPASIVAAGN
jgi:hypothetical protein